MFKRFVSIILSLIVTISALSALNITAIAGTYEEGLTNKGFPQSYVTGLSALHKKYPNWEFEPLFTGLEWAVAVDAERSSHSHQLIQMQSDLSSDYYCNCSSCYKNGTYVIREGSTWVSASKMAVEYYMDPRNWFDENHIFQFESILYDSSHTQSGVETILSSTWMHNANITYKTTTGDTATYLNSSGNTVKYSKAIIDAAKNSGISAYYLASKIVQEVGGKSATAGGACGTRSPFLGIYNYYNIGANSGAMDGLEWASGFLKAKTDTTLFSSYDSSKKEGSGTKTSVAKDQYMSYISESGNYYKVKLYNVSSGSYSTNGKTGYILKSDLRTTYFNYGRPWTDPYKSIYNGAVYIANSFSNTQFTGYLQKFNVNPASGSNMFTHEYMANVEGAAKESVTTYKAYSNAGLLPDKKVFYIPVYGNIGEQNLENNNSVVTGLKLKKREKTSLEFTWNSYPNATKYYMYVKNVTTGNNFSKTVTKNSATISGLNSGNEYKVKVKAYVNGAYIDYCSYVTAHTTPSKVTGLKVSKKTTNSVTLSWNKIKGVSGYCIYEYSSSSKSYKQVMTVSGDKTTNATVKKLTSGEKCSYAVCAYVSDSATKKGAKSSIVSTAVKPKKVEVKKSVSNSKGKIKTAWKAQQGSATGFQVQYAKDKAFKKKVATKTFSGKAKTSYTGKGFTKGKTYYVRVRAYTSVGSSRVYGSWSKVTKVKCN